MPNGSDYMNNQTYAAFQRAFFSSSYGAASAQYFYDIARSWPVILVAALVAMILGYLYLFLLRLMGGALIWVSFVSTFLILFGAGFYTYFYARVQYDPVVPTH